jgi:2-polyprenyl-6-methoxyphenol hydroxylase-like FAD-dependent oxidoreductase
VKATAPRTRFDALIVGAGPAGSAAAILLARAGWAVALVERQPFPRRKVCGECIAASNLPLLATLGVADAISTLAGPPLRQVALHRGDRVVTADLPAAAGAVHRWGRALGRETLDTLLLERARAEGAEVLQPWQVQNFQGAAGAWHVELRAAHSAALRRLRACLVIDAHGSWEDLPSARPQRRLARSGADLFAFKANFSGGALRAGVIDVLALQGGYGGMVLADGGITTLACCIRRDRLLSLRAASPGLRAAKRCRPGCRASAVPSGKPCRAHRCKARGWRPDRWTRAFGCARMMRSSASAMLPARRIPSWVKA